MNQSAQDKPAIPWGPRLPQKWIALCLALVLLVLGIWYFLFHIHVQAQPYSLDSFAMGSYVEQTVWGWGVRKERAAQNALWKVEDLEWNISWRDMRLASDYIPGTVFAINQTAGLKITWPLSRDVQDVFQSALELCEKSGGAFDMTVGPVTRLWDFDNAPHLPDEDELEAALALVDYKKLQINEENPGESNSATAAEHTAALIDPGMSIDLGAVGKGAACDVAVAQYQEAGVKGAVIAVGGSIGLYGEKPDGKPWRVSVRDPEGPGGLGVLELPGGFVSTSGSYEKYFEQDGKAYCHLLDPRTGYPAESGLVSVTVWCESSGAMSDGLATACFVLGREKGMALLDEFGAQGLFVDQEKRIHMTPELAERFTLTEQSYTLAEG